MVISVSKMYVYWLFHRSCYFGYIINLTDLTFDESNMTGYDMHHVDHVVKYFSIEKRKKKIHQSCDITYMPAI